MEFSAAARAKEKTAELANKKKSRLNLEEKGVVK